MLESENTDKPLHKPGLSWFDAASYKRWALSVIAYILLGLGLPALFWPSVFKGVMLGVIIGVGYLVSLFWNAHYPMGKYQIVFSLTRMVLFAYLIVVAGQFHVTEICIVFYGFFGYKLVLLVDMIGRSQNTASSVPVKSNPTNPYS